MHERLSVRDSVRLERILALEVEADKVRTAGNIRERDHSEERRRIDRALKKLGGYHKVCMVQRRGSQPRLQDEPTDSDGSDSGSSGDLLKSLSRPLTPLAGSPSSAPPQGQSIGNERKLGQTSSGRHFFLEDTDPECGWRKLDLVGAEPEDDGTDAQKRRPPQSPGSFRSSTGSPYPAQYLPRLTPGRSKTGQHSTEAPASPTSLPSSPKQGTSPGPPPLRRLPRKSASSLSIMAK